MRDLLAKITDPKLESAKQAVRINVIYKNSFDLAINFLAESVETLDRAKPRMIGETHTSGRGKGNNNPTSHGNGRFDRGRNRGGRNICGYRNHGGYGRGGRARGRGRANDNALTYVPPAKWNAMTTQQRQTFLQA